MREIAPELQADLIAQGITPRAYAPMASTIELVREVSRFGADGVCATRLSKALGWTRQRARFALIYAGRRGALARVSPGVYAAPSGPKE